LDGSLSDKYLPHGLNFLLNRNWGKVFDILPPKGGIIGEWA
jgi:hypothetical protein